MLITTCTHCAARFRVTPQQLNAKQGQVRCGRCRNVFSGFESLERFPDDDTGSRLPAARELQEVPPQHSAFIETLPIEDISPVQAPDEATPDLGPAGEPVAASSTSRRGRFAPLRHEAELTLDTEEPAQPPARAWTLGAVLLALVLAGELAFAFRGPLAQRYPVLRPWLESACAAAGCSVPWSRQEALLKLEESEMLEIPGKPSEIALGARIRNLATVAQEYPHLELTLTDLTGQAAARRVLRPMDYLGRQTHRGEVIPPGTEVAIQLRLETPRIKATGYELLLFYP